MTDIWTPEPERERVNFSQMDLFIDHPKDKNGNEYTKITFTLLPIGGGDVIADSYNKFSGHTKPWDSHVLPALREVVEKGKVSNAPDIHDKWVSWSFRQWRSYAKNDIQYRKDKAAELESQGLDEEAQKQYGFIQLDENGREFVNKRYVHILDVFLSEEEAQQANDDFYGVQSSGDAFSEPIEQTAKPPENFTDKSTALKFLPSIINMAKEGEKINMDKLKEMIENNDIFKSCGIKFDSPEVQLQLDDQIPF